MDSKAVQDYMIKWVTDFCVVGVFIWGGVSLIHCLLVSHWIPLFTTRGGTASWDAEKQGLWDLILKCTCTAQEGCFAHKHSQRPVQRLRMIATCALFQYSMPIFDSIVLLQGNYLYWNVYVMLHCYPETPWNGSYCQLFFFPHQVSHDWNSCLTCRNLSGTDFPFSQMAEFQHVPCNIAVKVAWTLSKK